MAWAAAAQASPLAFAAHARLASPDVRLGDVADTAGLPGTLRTEARALVLTRLPKGADHADYAAGRLAERARALMPALRPWLAGAADGEVTVVLGAGRGPGASPPETCLTAAAPLAAGAIPRTGDFVPAVCEHPVANAFRYRRQDGVVEVARALKIGDETHGVPLADLARVLPGQPLYVSAQVGPVRVERMVTAAQPAAARRAVFVRAEDGRVFSAPAPEVQP